MRSAVALAALALSQGAAATPPPCPGPRTDPAVPGPRLVLDANFPDPFVARFGRTYYAYATGAQLGERRRNVQVIRSLDLRNWSAPAEALPDANLPRWADARDVQVWAPEAARIGGRYVLYFNARHRTLTRTETPPSGPQVLKRHCIGAAVAARPEGPYRGAAKPLACAAFRDGTIDPSPFRDFGGRRYLYFKDDGNCCGRKSAIWGVRLRPDGLAPAGAPVRLFENDQSPAKYDDWEWRVVEAPTMVRRGGAYILLYSGNYFGNKNYSVGYRVCAGPLGPCRDPGDNPILWSHRASPLIGPGSQSVLAARTGDLIFFHGWNRDPDAHEVAGVHKRCLYVAPLEWVRGRPRVAGGTPQP
ncbi:MAG: family 43 glycosylhydrolase [Alphaproteobacteria bacterium]|nr:family 43 glycosylhydrolase [Alphaproteobacteria bacterium]